jgi:acyl-CoA hydrolase
MAFKRLTAAEAALLVKDGDNVGFSGFTPAGCPKSVPEAIAKHAQEENAYVNPFSLGMFRGASSGDRLDGGLARANAFKLSTPY